MKKYKNHIIVIIIFSVILLGVFCFIELNNFFVSKKCYKKARVVDSYKDTAIDYHMYYNCVQEKAINIF
jgi:hypothetical protein